MDFNDFIKAIKKFGKPVTRCMYVGPGGVKCNNRPISSHTLQKSGALKAIAKGGHVFSLETNSSPIKMDIEFKKVGVSKASTFPGYCKKHDSSAFKDIEGEFVALDEKSFALIALRIVSRELFTKLSQIRMYCDEGVRGEV